jgi:hypothetical protein
MKGIDAVIDIETLSSEPNAAVIGIGVAIIVDGKRSPDDDLEILIDPQSARIHGVIDPDTILWWLEQPTMKRAWSGTFTTAQAIDGFYAWLESMAERHQRPIDRVWGNAPTFDLSILRAMWRSQFKNWPFPFRGERCFRTALWMAQDLFGSVVEKRYADAENRHMPLADAIVEAESIIQIYESMGVDHES